MKLSDKEFKTFERQALAFLRIIGFAPVGYYPYEHFSDVSGYLSPSPPFKIPSKTMVEIVKTTPTRESVEGFYKLAKDSLASRMIIICSKNLSGLNSDVQHKIEELRIEFFDQQTILSGLEEKKISKSTILEYSELYDIFGAPLLATALPSIARQEIPEEMKEYTRKQGLEPWQVFEDAVFSIFHYCFNYTTQKLGEECLFKHEPEGIVVTSEIHRFALLYECKSAKKSYFMESDHELRYKDYIKNKIERIRILNGAPLEYFLIIAPEFSGDIAERRERIFRDTKVLTIFMPASEMSALATWACKLPSDIKRLIDLGSIFRLNETVVSMATIESYIKQFDQNRPRW